MAPSIQRPQCPFFPASKYVYATLNMAHINLPTIPYICMCVDFPYAYGIIHMWEHGGPFMDCYRDHVPTPHVQLQHIFRCKGATFNNYILAMYWDSQDIWYWKYSECKLYIEIITFFTILKLIAYISCAISSKKACYMCMCVQKVSNLKSIHKVVVSPHHIYI